jgi:hypothetical protein
VPGVCRSGNRIGHAICRPAGAGGVLFVGTIKIPSLTGLSRPSVNQQGKHHNLPSP